MVPLRRNLSHTCALSRIRPATSSASHLLASKPHSGQARSRIHIQSFVSGSITRVSIRLLTLSGSTSSNGLLDPPTDRPDVGLEASARSLGGHLLLLRPGAPNRRYGAGGQATTPRQRIAPTLTVEPFPRTLRWQPTWHQVLSPSSRSGRDSVRPAHLRPPSEGGSQVLRRGQGPLPKMSCVVAKRVGC